MKRKIAPLMILLICCLMVFSACSLFKGVDNSKITAYLNSVGTDFERSKESLKVFDGDFNSDANGAAESLGLAKKSKSDLQAMMENAKKLGVPDNPKELRDFHDMLIEYYNDSIQLTGGYEQILNYSMELYKSIYPIEKAASTDIGNSPSMSDVMGMMNTIKSSMNQSITIAKSCTPPQYLVSSHANYTDILTKYSSATDDFIYALQLEDPLRINATSYRYELLANKLKYIGDDMSKDIDNQTVKMKELGGKLEKSQDDLYKKLLLWKSEYKIGS